MHSKIPKRLHSDGQLCQKDTYETMSGKGKLYIYNKKVFENSGSISQSSVTISDCCAE